MLFSNFVWWNYPRYAELEILTQSGSSPERLCVMVVLFESVWQPQLPTPPGHLEAGDNLWRSAGSLVWLLTAVGSQNLGCRVLRSPQKPSQGLLRTPRAHWLSVCVFSHAVPRHSIRKTTGLKASVFPWQSEAGPSELTLHQTTTAG